MKRSPHASFVALLLACTLPLEAAPPRGGRPGWIDVHSHLAVGRGGAVSAAVAAALGSMQRHGIGRLILMPPPQVTGMMQNVSAEELAAAAASHPDRIAFLGGGGCLNKMIHDASAAGRVTESTRKAFEARANALLAMGAAGFGEMASLHISHEARHPYEWTPADHPLFLLLADIAARAHVPIDLHMDLVTEDMKTPSRWPSPRNPPVLRENLGALERLLAHNRGAKIVWAHAGSDPLGNQTPELIGGLLARHPNLHVSLRPGPGARPDVNLLVENGSLRPAWQRLFESNPDRFVLGIDQFIPGGDVRGTPLSELVPRGDRVCGNARRLLQSLPRSLARRLAFENALALYGRGAPARR